MRNSTTHPPTHPGNRYEGQWVDNLRSGQGTLFYADGGKYEGFFKVPLNPPTHPPI